VEKKKKGPKHEETRQGEEQDKKLRLEDGELAPLAQKKEGRGKKQLDDSARKRRSGNLEKVHEEPKKK